LIKAIKIKKGSSICQRFLQILRMKRVEEIMMKMEQSLAILSTHCLWPIIFILLLNLIRIFQRVRAKYSKLIIMILQRQKRQALLFIFCRLKPLAECSWA